LVKSGPDLDVEPGVDHDTELNFLRDLREPVSAWRLSRAAMGSIGVHAFAILLFWLTPEIEPYRLPHTITPEELRKSLVLIVPRDLIQHDRGSDSQSGDGGRQQHTSAASAPRPAAPQRFHPPAPTPGQPATDTHAPMLQAPVIEAPTESVAPPALIAGAGVPGAVTGTGVAAPAPRPKSPFEAVGGGVPPRLPNEPISPAEQAIRAAARSGGGISLHTDTSQDTSGLPEILSDTHGVDFTQYLAQAKNRIKSNWNTTEVVRLGLRGVVRVDFKIDRQGGVHDLKIVGPSGSSVLDLAAVRAITSSVPFAFLPPAYKDRDVEFVWTFTYTYTHR
jgi:TonB family protein